MIVMPNDIVSLGCPGGQRVRIICISLTSIPSMSSRMAVALSFPDLPVSYSRCNKDEQIPFADRYLQSRGIRV